MDEERFPKHLTVIFRDDAPVIFVGDVPAYRRVTIELTAEQRDALALKQVGINCGKPVYEAYSKCFLEGE